MARNGLDFGAKPWRDFDGIYSDAGMSDLNRALPFPIYHCVPGISMDKLMSRINTRQKHDLRGVLWLIIEESTKHKQWQPYQVPMAVFPKERFGQAQEVVDHIRSKEKAYSDFISGVREGERLDLVKSMEVCMHEDYLTVFPTQDFALAYCHLSQG